jgi:hypothetical protein
VEYCTFFPSKEAEKNGFQLVGVLEIPDVHRSYAGAPDKTVIDKFLVSLSKLKLKGIYYERSNGGGKSAAQAPHQDHTKDYLHKVVQQRFLF